MRVVRSFANYYWSFRISLYSRNVTQRILPSLQHDTLRKYGTRLLLGNEVDGYVHARAMQLAQPLVDRIISENPSIPCILGNRMLVCSAQKASGVIANSRRRRLIAK
ncbi:MAG TPA: hypothetical protein VH107_12965 [Lacipirellulaceae bacterium]|jgi:hypothetical protein|nr:hypothetical protein [Lacipirellulaceae bacterium]